jgi:hypothetical protein
MSAFSTGMNYYLEMQKCVRIPDGVLEKISEHFNQIPMSPP